MDGANEHSGEANMSSVWVNVTTTPSILGESPFWHPHEQRLYWVDIVGLKINRLHTESGVQDEWEMPQEPSCIAPAESGGLIIALRDGFYRARKWGDELIPIATTKTGHFDFDTKIMRFNDGKCDAEGRFWCGTMIEPRTPKIGTLYSLEMIAGFPIVKQQASGASVPNGLAWSKDNKTMYWSDSFNHVLRIFDWNSKSNTLSNEKILREFPRKAEAAVYGGRPDGATLDSAGNYYVALMEAQGILKLSPTHQELARISAPVLCPTMPCFGGVDLKTLFITTTRENRSVEELAAQPLAGHVFSRRMEIAGVPVNFFKD